MHIVKHRGYLIVIIHGKIVGKRYIGGVTADLYKFASMENCYNTGIITNSNNEEELVYIGGVTALSSLSESEEYKIIKCYNVGDLVLNSTSDEGTFYLGNISAYHETGKIENCYYINNGNNGIGVCEDNENIKSIVAVEKGDANGDNQVNFSDILVINNHRLGKTELTGIYLEVADVTGDSNIDFRDILQVNRYRLGKIDSL